MKILGIECYGILDAKYYTTSKVLWSTQVVVEWKALYTILRNSDGNRYVLYLYWNDGKWNWNYNWLDNKFDANNPSLVLATISFLSL